MVNFRMDSELKKNMEQVCKEMGMSMTTAFTIFATKVSREKRIPFEISADPFYSDANISAIKESLEQHKNGNVIIKSFEELEELANG